MNEIVKWIAVGVLVTFLVICFMWAFYCILTMLVEAVREEVEDLRKMQKKRKVLTAENGWHECKEFDWDLPEVGELCVLRVKYKEFEHDEVWEVRYITAEWTGCEWTQDSMGFLRYQEVSDITHWKAVKRVEE